MLTMRKRLIDYIALIGFAIAFFGIVETDVHASEMKGIEANSLRYANSYRELQIKNNWTSQVVLESARANAIDYVNKKQREEAATIYLAIFHLVSKEKPSEQRTFFMVDSALQSGQLLWDLGIRQPAIKYLDLAYSLSKNSIMLSDETRVDLLQRLGNGYFEIRDYKNALVYFQLALDYSEAKKDIEPSKRLTALIGLFDVYFELGEYTRAKQYADKAFMVASDAYGPKSKFTGAALSMQYQVLAALKDWENAQILERKANEILSKEISNLPSDWSWHQESAAAAADGDYSRMFDLARLRISEVEKRSGLFAPELEDELSSLALLLVQRGDVNEGLLVARRSVLLALGNRDHDLFSRHLTFMVGSICEMAAGNTDLAITDAKLAVSLIQQQRKQIDLLPENLKKAFIEKYENGYRLLIDLLLMISRVPEAQEVLSLLKQEEHNDFISRDGSSAIAAKPVSLSQYETWIGAELQSVAGAISKLQSERVRLINASSVDGNSSIGRDLAEIDRKIQSLLKGIESALKKAPSPRDRTVINEASSTIQLLRFTQESLKQLAHGSVLLQYVVTDKSVLIILTGPETQISREVKTSTLDLKINVGQFTGAVLTNPKKNPLPLAQDLYKILIEPVAADLERLHAHTVMLSLDDVLRYVPFAALHDGKQFLVERYAFAMYTDVAKENIRVLPNDSWRVAGMGLTQGVQQKEVSFAPLPSVLDELEGVVKTVSPRTNEGVLPGEIYLDKEFTKSQLQMALISRFQVLHIASHFMFRPGVESDSYLVLGDGSQLTLGDFRRNRWNFSLLDLVTLSACDTGKGGGFRQDGKEVEGLGALIQRLGAKSIMASLWSVSDQSTAALMKSFYRYHQEKKATKADALREAQLSMLRGANDRGSASLFSKLLRNKPDFKHPFYWAPFILMGNWL